MLHGQCSVRVLPVCQTCFPQWLTWTFLCSSVDRANSPVSLVLRTLSSPQEQDPFDLFNPKVLIVKYCPTGSLTSPYELVRIEMLGANQWAARFTIPPCWRRSVLPWISASCHQILRKYELSKFNKVSVSLGALWMSQNTFCGEVWWCLLIWFLYHYQPRTSSAWRLKHLQGWAG